MTTEKKLLLSNLTKKGFTYYPEMQRFLLKNESKSSAEVIILEMTAENCRLFYSKKDNKTAEIVAKHTFAYNAEVILNFIESLLVDQNNNTYSTAA